jgi:GMP synthase (glutamine-hydrolysing)
MPRGLALTHSLIQATRQENHTVVGICLGAQMIAETLWPGGVGAAERIEVGLTEIWWGDQNGQRIIVPAFHYERIHPSTPVGGEAEIVAGNAHSPVQGFRVDSRIWGLQFHPEFQPQDMRHMALHHRQTIESYRGTAESALRSVDQLESRWKDDLFDQIFHRIIGH